VRCDAGQRFEDFFPKGGFVLLICEVEKCTYTHNHGPIRDSDIEFCPDCGSRLKEIADKGFTPILPASRGRRFVGLMIDEVLTWPFGFLLVIPILGQEVLAFVVLVFWFLRDMNGKSLGKALAGTSIVNHLGAPATARQRFVRNIPFALPILLLFVPLTGVPVAYFFQGIAFMAEAGAVIFTGERLGDKLAGTIVIKGTGVRSKYRRNLGAEL
jgi:uncharacterized RDD family membrane protein YckC